MTYKNSRRTIALTLITVVIASYQACSPTGMRGAGPVNSTDPKGLSNASSYAGGGTSTDNPKVSVNLSVAGFTSETIASVDFCVNEVRFISETGAIMKLDDGVAAELANAVKSAARSQSVDPEREEKNMEQALERAAKDAEKQARAAKKEAERALKQAKEDFYDACEEQAEAKELEADRARQRFDEDQWERACKASFFSTMLSNPFQSAGGSDWFLDKFLIPTNSYKAIEFELGGECPNGTLSVVKASGPLTSNDELVMRFEGQFNIKNAKDIRLDIQPLIDGLGRATTPAQFPNILMSVSGGIQ